MRARSWMMLVAATAGCNSILGNGDFAGPDPGEPRLEALAVTGGALVPAFSPDQLEYTVEVGFAIAREQVIAVATGELELDGAGLASGERSPPVALAADATTDLHVTVVGGAGYTIHVHRAAAVGRERLFKPAGSEGQGTSISTPAQQLYGDGAGFAVATDGETLVIGAPGSDDGPGDDTARNCGAVYVYRRSATGWRLDGTLRAPVAVVDEQLGASVAVRGDVIVAGTRGGEAVYVWERIEGSWTSGTRLTASAPTAGDWFGYAVAIDRDLIVVGAPFEDGAGTGVDPAIDEATSSSGAAYVFRRAPSGAWQQAAYLKATNPGADDLFGWSVAVQAGTVIVGAPQEDSAARGTPGDDSLIDAGALYAFAPAGTTWDRPQYVKAAHPRYADGLGSSLALDGDLLVTGAQTLDARTGRAVAFRNRTGSWSETASFSGFAASNFGASVAVAGDTIAVGAPNYSNCNGRAFLYLPTASGWDPPVDVSDFTGCELFGQAVALARDGTLAVGAPNDARSGRGILDASAPDVSNDDGGSGVVLTVR